MAVSGERRQKEDGDPALRACFEAPQYNELTEWISKLAEAKKQSKALCYGNFYSVVLTNGQCVFGRECDGEKVFVCINAAGQSFSRALIWERVMPQTDYR